MAIYDVIFAVIDQSLVDNNITSPLSSPSKTPVSASKNTEDDSITLEFDELFKSAFLWRSIFPPVESVFQIENSFTRSTGGRSSKVMPTLSQNDILSCLKALSMVRYVDVRVNILRGLEHFIQELGQCLSAQRETGGWKVVLELISAVPLSMTDENVQNDWSKTRRDSYNYDSNKESIASLANAAISPESEENLTDETVLTLLPQFQWPKETLYDSFNCISLIVDEFLDLILMDSLLIQAVLESLSLFGSQRIDINTSLTAVEMIWKVADAALKAGLAKASSFQATTTDLSGGPVENSNNFVMDIMLNLLFDLSMDERPELRHCAINTLFSAMSANSLMLKVEQWQKIFETIIFPLFEKTGERSKNAMKQKEEAFIPEMKKGVKISIHHSRDTAHKQWSETRVLTLRGMLRLLKTCTRLLITEQWFHEIWIDSILVCDQAILVADFELEVALAGVEVFFGMLTVITDFSNDAEVDFSLPPAPLKDNQKGTKSTAPPASTTTATAGPAFGLSGKQNKIDLATLELIERNKSKLWNITFAAVQQCALHCYSSIDLAISVSNKLLKLYAANRDKEFRYNENIRILLNIIISVSRPVIKPISLSSPSSETSSSSATVMARSKKNDEWTRKGQQSELKRIIITLFKSIKISDVSSLELYFMAMSEIIFACRKSLILPSTPPSSSSSSSSSASAANATGVTEKSTSSSTTNAEGLLVFSVVPMDLREELTALLMSILSSSSSSSNNNSLQASLLKASLKNEEEGESSPSDPPKQLCQISQSLLQPASSTYNQILMIIIKRYFFDIVIPVFMKKLLKIRYESTQQQQNDGLEESNKIPFIKFYYFLLKESKYFVSTLSFLNMNNLNNLLETYWDHFQSSFTPKKLEKVDSGDDINLQAVMAAAAAEREEQEENHLMILEKLLFQLFPQMKNDRPSSAMTSGKTEMLTGESSINLIPLPPSIQGSHQEMMDNSNNPWMAFSPLPLENSLLFYCIKQLLQTATAPPSSSSSAGVLSLKFSVQQQDQFHNCYEIMLFILLTHLSPWKYSDLYSSPDQTAAKETTTNQSKPNSPEATQKKEKSGGENTQMQEIFEIVSIFRQSNRLSNRQKIQLLQVLLGSLLQSLFLIENVLTTNDGNSGNNASSASPHHQRKEFSSNFLEETILFLSFMKDFCYEMISMISDELKEKESENSGDSLALLRKNGLYCMMIISRQLCNIVLLKDEKTNQLFTQICLNYLSLLMNLTPESSSAVTADEKQSSTSNCSYQWKKDIFQDDYYQLTARKQQRNQSKSNQQRLDSKRLNYLWSELISNIVIIRPMATSQLSSASNRMSISNTTNNNKNMKNKGDFYLNLFRFVDNYVEIDESDSVTDMERGDVANLKKNQGNTNQGFLSPAKKPSSFLSSQVFNLTSSPSSSPTVRKSQNNNNNQQTASDANNDKEDSSHDSFPVEVDNKFHIINLYSHLIDILCEMDDSNLRERSGSLLK
jgi:hypothetical protein